MKEKGKDYVKINEETSMVFSEIPWENYIDRISFTGRLPKGGKTVTRSITLDAKELRIAEIICESSKMMFQTVSDVLRDTIRKGLAFDYEILVRRQGKIKLRGEALYRELAHVDEELAILECIEMVENRIKAILKASLKSIAGRDKEWAENEIFLLISAAEGDYPGKGIKEYFHALLHEPQGAKSIIHNIENSRKFNKGGF
jgi:hypothetical protein